MFVHIFSSYWKILVFRLLRNLMILYVFADTDRRMELHTVLSWYLFSLFRVVFHYILWSHHYMGWLFHYVRYLVRYMRYLLNSTRYLFHYVRCMLYDIGGAFFDICRVFAFYAVMFHCIRCLIVFHHTWRTILYTRCFLHEGPFPDIRGAFLIVCGS